MRLQTNEGSSESIQQGNHSSASSGQNHTLEKGMQFWSHWFVYQEILCKAGKDTSKFLSTIDPFTSNPNFQNLKFFGGIHKNFPGSWMFQSRSKIQNFTA